MTAKFREFGVKLGQGLAVLVDLLNPERIVLGGIFLRCDDLIVPSMRETLEAECLTPNLAACEIMRASSGERIGDHAAWAAARYLSDADPLDQLTRRFPELAVCRRELADAAERLAAAFRNGNKLLLCGNGGSWADCEHITGELLKAFARKRPVAADLKANLPPALSARLQGALPAIHLGAAGAFSSAYGNDVEASAVYAQAVNALGQPGDVLLAISTSGQSENILMAAQVARARGLHVIGLTGRSGGALRAHCDSCVTVPETTTYRVQELHLPLYHTLCLLLEDRLFGP